MQILELIPVILVADYPHWRSLGVCMAHYVNGQLSIVKGSSPELSTRNAEYYNELHVLDGKREMTIIAKVVQVSECLMQSRQQFRLSYTKKEKTHAELLVKAECDRSVIDCSLRG
ncbi:hypothetical protein INS49_004354 [Diaporthe citri]|uniref:uncharacterized protein n=1 Tax=Diaporthe citri TaxID=83186 RepID=UPI001C81A8C5|nr:uncharacterized protein INS49_004354 [Diaporthe citri]KAG6355272.1 hypothetical protein INS49_004354 [Diaporthe citri]